MTTVEFRLVSLEDAITHLQGKKIIPAIKVDKTFYDKDPRYCEYGHNVTFFDDDTCMTLFTNWKRGYYGEIDAVDPLFYIGKVVRT